MLSFVGLKLNYTQLTTVNIIDVLTAIFCDNDHNIQCYQMHKHRKLIKKLHLNYKIINNNLPQ